MPADRDWPTGAANAAEPWRVRRADREGSTAAEASPVVPVPPCSTCGGAGVVIVQDVRSLCNGGAPPDEQTCDDCNGTGHDRLIPESEIRARLDEMANDLRDDLYDSHEGPPPHFALGCDAAIEDLFSWLDERGER